MSEQIALKEWSVAVRALALGNQDVIFRKGGISEPSGHFEMQHHQFLLYPAREHQKPQFLKPQFLSLLETDTANQIGHRVTIEAKATVKAIHPVQTFDETLRFSHRHIWNDYFIRMRLNYKPDRPLYIIELSVEPLPAPIVFTETTEQAGCKSWVTVSS